MNETFYIVIIVLLIFALLYSLTREPRVKVVEVERKSHKPRRKKEPIGPVDVDQELQRIARMIESRHGMASTIRNVAAVSGDRRVEWWLDEEGRWVFNFQDVLEYMRYQEQMRQYEQNFAPQTLPEQGREYAANQG